MEKKINIAELLKHCPKGMELDCVLYEDVTFECILDESSYPIKVQTLEGKMLLSEYGCLSVSKHAKCVIFPKGKTTWEGFVPPCKFKDGDVVVAGDAELFQLFLLKYLTHSEDDNDYDGYCYFGWDFQCNELFEEGTWGFNRLATEEEKAKLFQAIKDNGYRWNPETKTLEKLVEPRFKVGDKIKHKEKTRWVCTIRRVEDIYYVDGHPMCYTLPFGKQDEYELIPNKFDINTLKPYDKVLVRDNNEQLWVADLFGFHDDRMVYKFMCVGHNVNQCIPYNDDTKHLLGTTDDCDEYFKTWE